MVRLLAVVCLTGLGTAAIWAQAAGSGTQAALALEKQGDYRQAEASWQRVTETAPADAVAWAHLGLVRALEQHYAEAVPAYRKALALAPRFPGLAIDLGLALFKEGHLSEAIPVLQDAEREAPQDLRPKLLLGMSYYGTGQYAQAVPYLKDGVAQAPANLPLRETLAQSCLWSHAYPCVLEQGKAILEQDPNSAQADMLAGEALDATGDTTGAIAQFRAAVQAAPSAPDAHFGLGYLLWKQQQLADAATEFRAELAIDPDNEGALAYLGDAEMKANEDPSARDTLARALQQPHPMAIAYLDTGILDERQGEAAAAESALQQAIRIDPGDVDAHWHLARLYERSGRKALAQAEIARVNQIHRSKDAPLLEALKKPADSVSAK